MEKYFNNMNYLKIYNCLINKAKERASSKKEALQIIGYNERHHIIPKCIGGDNTNLNLVFLTASEHYVAHQLLVKIYPNEPKLVFAANMMSKNAKTNNRANNKSYEWIRKKHAKCMSSTLKGRTKDTHEYLKIQGQQHSLRMKGKNAENCPNIAAAAKRRKGKTKNNCEFIAKMAAKKLGQNKSNNKSIQQGAEKQNILSKDQRLYLINLKNSGKTFTEIKYYFNNLNINISYSTISQIYYREYKPIDLSENIIKEIQELKRKRIKIDDISKYFLSKGIEITYAQIKKVK